MYAGFSPEKKSSMVSVYNTAGVGGGVHWNPLPLPELKFVLNVMVLVVTVILNAVVS